MKHLEKAHLKNKELQESGGVERLNPIERAKKNPNSRAMAMKAMCWDCQGRDYDPAVRWRIGNCECPECPLFTLRPYRHLNDTDTPTSLVM